MRLIQSYRDYYDGVQRTDREPSPVYLRKRSILEVEEGDKAGLARFRALVEPFGHFPRTPSEGRFTRFQVERFALGFCGTVFPFFFWQGAAFATFDEVRGAILAFPNSHHLHHNDQIDLRQLKSEVGAAESKFWAPHDRPFSNHGWVHWLAHGAPAWAKPQDDLFRLVGAPVFLFAQGYKGLAIHKNPCLKDLGMQRILHPFHVWQSIDQYLSNQMVKQEDLSCDGYTDELRRDAHGFNDRSFKADGPSAKKLRRKENRRRKTRSKKGRP